MPGQPKPQDRMDGLDEFSDLHFGSVLLCRTRLAVATCMIHTFSTPTAVGIYSRNQAVLEMIIPMVIVDRTRGGI